MTKQTAKEKRKTTMFGWLKTGPKTLAFGYDQTGALEDPAIKPMPGRQNKRKGTKYRKITRIAKQSRKRNRAKTR